MEYTKIIDNGLFKLNMSGKFTFTDHNNYKRLFDIIRDDNVEEIELDISGVEFVDSAALGLLLLTKDEVEKNGKKLRIKNPQGQVKKMFEISRFYDLFDVS